MSRHLKQTQDATGRNEQGSDACSPAKSQQLNENVLAQVCGSHSRISFHFHLGPATVVQGDVKNKNQMTMNIKNTRVGSIAAMSASSSSPDGAFPIASPRKDKAMTTALLSLLKALHFPEEDELQILATIQKAGNPTFDHSVSKQQNKLESEGATANADDADYMQIDKIISWINSIKLEDGIIDLTCQGLKALIQDDDAEKSTQDFINAYEEEDVSIPSKLYKKFDGLKEPLHRVWNDIILKITVETCQEHFECKNPIVKYLAHTCSNIAIKLMQQGNLEHSLSSFALRANDFTKMGNVFAHTRNFFNTAASYFASDSYEKYIHAVVSYFTVSKLAKLKSEEDEKLKNIHYCVYKVQLVVEEMAERESMKTIIIDHVIPLMRQMIEFLELTENACNKVKAEYKVWCLGMISLCYEYCGEHRQEANEDEFIIEFMKKEFAEEAETHQFYCMCLQNAGVAYERIGNYGKAVESYKKSLEACENVKDWTNEKVKNLFLTSTKELLKAAQSMLQT